MIHKLFGGAMAQARTDRRAKQYRELIRREAAIGGQLFGPVRPGGRREFFCLDQHTWVWHEEWTDPQTGKRLAITTRYDVRPHGIFKAQDGQPYQPLNRTESAHLRKAALLYNERVRAELYANVA